MNVVVIDIDSLRQDHVGAYGYPKPTTPNIDAFTEDAIRFDRAYVANSPCMPSRAALISGRHGVSNGIETHGSRSQVLSSPHTWTDYGRDDALERAPDYRTLPEVFFEDDRAAIAVSSFPRHPAPWFYHLWTDFHHPREPSGEMEYFQTPRGETVTDLAIESLEDLDRRGGDGLVYVQYWDPHAPYKRSDEAVERFRDGDLPPYPTQDQIETHHGRDRWRSASDPDLDHSLRHSTYETVENREALGELLAHYDAEIRYVDRHVGRLLDALRDRDRYDDSLIVITADHGEEFGEHGCYREHWSTHDGTQRVPLFVKPPSGATDASPSPSAAGSARDHLVTNVDLAPTIADYADLDAPGAWQGESLRPVLDDQNADWRDRIVVDHGLYTAQRAVRTDRWKFVRTYNDGEWDLPDRALFDMRKDPWEQENLVGEHPGVAAELERDMAVWVEAHVGEEGDELREVARTGPAGLSLYQ